MKEKTKSITVLFVPLNATGHINTVKAIGNTLIKRGNRVVIAVDQLWRYTLNETEFEVKLYNQHDPETNIHKPFQFWEKIIKKFSPDLNKSVEDQLQLYYEDMKLFIDLIKYSDEQMKTIVNEVKPDIIIHDHYVCYPSLLASGIPVVPLFSSNPLSVTDDIRVPPEHSGYPTKDKTNWDTYRRKKRAILYPLWLEFNNWVIERNGPSLEEMSFQNESQYLNLYLFPGVLDYTDIRPLWTNWHRIDCVDYLRIVKEETKRFILPENLRIINNKYKNESKLIYLSLGSFGSSNVNLMKRIIKILSKSPHRFIVTKGTHHQEYELADNMWGEEFVPQLQVLQNVDLALTHGGNRSLIECLYFGVPVIVLPLFWDQHDNGQRIKELNLGQSFNPFEVNEDDLLKAVDFYSTDIELHKKYKDISLNLQKSKSLEMAAKRIEDVIKYMIINY